MDPKRLSLARLDSPVPFTVSDAVAVIVQLARSPQTGRPSRERLSPEHVWLASDGSVTLSPGILPTRAEVAVLLDRLLSVIQETQPDSVPHTLCVLVDRAAGQLADPKMPSLTAFAAALAPFQPPDPAAAIRAMVEAADADAEAEAAAPAPVLVLVPPSPVIVPPVTMAPAVTAAAIAAPVPEPLMRARPEAVTEPIATPVAAPIATQVAAPITAPIAAPSPTPILLPVSSPPPPSSPMPRRWGRLAAGTLAACAVASLIGVRVARDLRHETPVSAAAPGPSAAAGPSDDLAMTTTPVSVTTPEPARDVPATTTEPAASPAKAAAPVPRAAAPVATVTAPHPPEPLVAAASVDADAVYSPSFAGNGSAVFFHAETGSGSALKRADAGERGELRIATIVDDGARNYHVQLSPTGRTVAFDSDRDGVRGVYVATADGRNVRRVSGPGYAAVPTWAPDGDRLAFIRGEADRPAVWNLWLLDLETGRQSRVTSFRRGQVWGATWFADGRRIAFSHEDRLTIHDLDSGESRAFTSPIAGRQVRTPAVSPDGQWIVFQVVRDGVWLLDVPRGTMRRVLEDASAEEFAWSPDGSRVAYHSRRSGGWGLWTMAGPAGS